MGLVDTKPILGLVEEVGGPVDMEAYESGGGYEAARNALTQMTPEEIIGVVKDANLRGRGRRLSYWIEMEFCSSGRCGRRGC